MNFKTDSMAIAVGWFCRIISAFTGILVIKLWIGNLGVEGYATVVVCLSVYSWMLLADAGFANTLQSVVSRAAARGIDGSQQILFCVNWTCRRALALTTVWFFLAGILAPVLLPQQVAGHGWMWAYCLLLTVGLTGIGSSVGGLVVRVWIGEGRGWLSFVLPAGMSLLGLTMTWLLEIRSVLLAWVVWQAPVMLALLVLTVRRLRSEQVNSILNVSDDPVLRRESSEYFIFAVLAAAVLQVDILILATLTDATALAEYSIAQRLYAFAFSFVVAVITITRTRVIGLLVHADAIGLRRNARKFMLTYLSLWCVGMFTLVFGGGELIVNWLGAEKLSISLALMLVLGIYGLCRVWTDYWSMVLIAMSDHRALIRCVTLQAIITWVGFLLAVPQWGAVGAAVALLAGFLSTACWYLPYRVAAHLNNLSQDVRG